jgi:hypothetical protein
MLRRATREDKPALIRIAKEQAARYPRRRSDIEKINNALTEVIGNSKHFAEVVDIDGEVKCVLVGITAEALWSPRKNCTIALWESKAPGGGAKLLRSFRDWVKSGRSITLAGITPDLDLDPRIYKLLEHNGFEKHGGSYLLHN